MIWLISIATPIILGMIACIGLLVYNIFFVNEAVENASNKIYHIARSFGLSSTSKGAIDDLLNTQSVEEIDYVSLAKQEMDVSNENSLVKVCENRLPKFHSFSHDEKNVVMKSCLHGRVDSMRDYAYQQSIEKDVMKNFNKKQEQSNSESLSIESLSDDWDNEYNALIGNTESTQGRVR